MFHLLVRFAFSQKVSDLVTELLNIGRLRFRQPEITLFNLEPTDIGIYSV